jgi:sugar lactone lactonase YvrE
MTAPACSGIAATPAATNAGFAHSLRDAGAGKDRLLYVSDYLLDDVVVFPASEQAGNAAPVRTIPLDSVPIGVWVDRKGVLYAVVGTQIEEFSRGSSTPFLTLSDGLEEPISVAVDGSGTVYVNDQEKTNAAIVEYPAGQTTPSKSIALTVPGTLFSFAGGMAFDKAQNLYVTEFFYPKNPAHVYRIQRGGSTAKDLALQGVGNEAGLGVDDRGNIYAGNENFGVNVYAPGERSPTRTFPLETQGPSLFAVTRDGELYAPQEYHALGSVAEYARNGSTPVNTISGTYLSEPIGAALEAETP